MNLREDVSIDNLMLFPPLHSFSGAATIGSAVIGLAGDQAREARIVSAVPKQRAGKNSERKRADQMAGPFARIWFSSRLPHVPRGCQALRLPIQERPACSVGAGSAMHARVSGRPARVR